MRAIGITTTIRGIIRFSSLFRFARACARVYLKQVDGGVHGREDVYERVYSLISRLCVAVHTRALLLILDYWIASGTRVSYLTEIASLFAYTLRRVLGKQGFNDPRVSYGLGTY